MPKAWTEACVDDEDSAMYDDGMVLGSQASTLTKSVVCHFHMKENE